METTDTVNTKIMYQRTKEKGRKKRKYATFDIKILKILQPENHFDLGTK